MAVNSTLSFTLCFAVFLIISAAAIAAQQTPTLNLTEPTEADYPKTLNDIREIVKGKEIWNDIPMMEKLAIYTKFFVVKLLVKTTQNTDITLLVAIDKANLYVSGYADEITRKAYLLKDYKDQKLSDVFEDIGRTLTKVELTYKSDYPGILGAANISKTDVKGSLYEFKRKIVDVAGEDFSRTTSDSEKRQATFILYATQVISEATRFTYIQGKFSNGTGAKLDYTVISLENGWSTISKAVKKAAARGDGKLQPAVMLQHPNGSHWEVRTVADVKPLVAILLYVVVE